MTDTVKRIKRDHIHNARLLFIVEHPTPLVGFNDVDCTKNMSSSLLKKSDIIPI